jgi:HEAT repeat protein
VPADDATLRRLIGELDAERYVVRRAAFAELSARGPQAVPALRAALGRGGSSRLRGAVQELLDAPTAREAPDPRRRERAARALERTGTPAAQKVLAALAAPE